MKIRMLSNNRGLLQFLPAALALGGAVYAGSQKNDKLALPPVPTYYEDPDYRQTQDFLKTLGIDILGGKVPDYYSAIGQTNSPEFQSYLNQNIGDIQKNAFESSAAMGRHVDTTQAVGDYTTQARYADYLRALEGKQYLFGEGRGITEGVRAAGQQEGVNRNAFNFNAYDRSLNDILTRTDYQNQQSAQRGQNVGQLLSMGAGAFAGAAGGGGFMGGLSGLMGGVNWQDIFKQSQNKTTTSSIPSNDPIASLGKIGSTNYLDEIFNSLKMN